MARPVRYPISGARVYAQSGYSAEAIQTGVAAQAYTLDGGALRAAGVKDAVIASADASAWNR